MTSTGRITGPPLAAPSWVDEGEYGVLGGSEPPLSFHARIHDASGDTDPVDSSVGVDQVASDAAKKREGLLGLCMRRAVTTSQVVPAGPACHPFGWN